MDTRICRFIDLLFEDIPYSEETFLAQKKMKTALSRSEEHTSELQSPA